MWCILWTHGMDLQFISRKSQSHVSRRRSHCCDIKIKSVFCHFTSLAFTKEIIIAAAAAFVIFIQAANILHVFPGGSGLTTEVTEPTAAAPITF